MDIQLLLNAPGQGAGNRNAAEDTEAPSGVFARHLAGASQAQGGDAEKAATPMVEASSRQAGASLTPLGAIRGQGEASADDATGREALQALLAKVSGETAPQTGEHTALAERLASLLDSSSEEVEAALQALMQGGQRPGGSESVNRESLAAALQALQQSDGQQADAKASNGGIWDAFQERLALIERAGRPETDDALAALPLAAAGGAAVAHPTAPPGSAPDATIRTNPLLEAIAAERRGSAAPSSANAAALSAAAERLSAQGAGQAGAASGEAQRLAAAGDALLAQRGETPRTNGGLEPANQGAGSALPGVMSAATGGTAGSPIGTAASQAQASLTAPVASPAWSQQLGQQLVRLSQQGGEQRVELKLHPAELGPLSVSLKMGDHGAQAQFVSAHAQVRQALEQAIPQLREALAEQGISLGETSVGEQRQGGNEGDGASGQSGGMLASRGGDAAEEGTHAPLEERGVREVAVDGRVDLYA